MLCFITTLHCRTLCLYIYIYELYCVQIVEVYRPLTVRFGRVRLSMDRWMTSLPVANYPRSKETKSRNPINNTG